ncbi:MAG TPA: DUF5320 domain-containing protein [Desulfovibrio sp.]|uniref:DUF5320 domain-containing protein n=1 Tax=Desulfovibrio TaxID=872 RepID=UPI002A4740CD|nr:DUF5320 domain-containing protein [Desulfovibrio sp.]MDY0304805.1 DUF5320 domain-containing protein [Desulfovibrionaceae bacterium]HMM39487.1 DUF5320 domain-containing protein [Desulfovibrio sp.]
MPNQDRTGPLGQGPMTGGGFGRCGAAREAGNDVDQPGSGRGFGQGQGLGQGQGRGRRCAAGTGQARAGQGRGFFGFGRNPRTVEPEQDRLAALENEIAELKRQLQEARK